MAEGWGNVVQHWQAYGKAYISWQSETQVDVTCESYFHSIKWGYDVAGNGTASVNNQTANSGRVTLYSPTGGTVNQRLATKTVRFNKTTSSKNISCYAQVQVTGGYHNGTSTAWMNVSIPALKSYTVSYNANGGTGAPGSQTKWYGSNITLSTTRPTREGYMFQGWSTSNDSTVEYQPGATYSSNSSVTLYAVWKINTWTVTYDANGGTGAPAAQTKVYGQTLTLSSTKPTKNLYNFKGWGTSAGSTTAEYQPGGSYTANTDITLYAIWELAWVAPRITNLQATRCDSAGTLTEEGQYAKVSFNWETDRTVSKIAIVCNGVTVNGSGSGTSGSVSLVLGNNALSTEKEYPITVTITDAVGSGSMSTTVAPMNYLIDFKGDGSGVAIGKPATLDHTFEIDYPTRMNRNVTVGGTMTANAATVTNNLTAKSINIGDILSIRGETVTDYIVASGTSGIWEYRKWASGLAECVGIYTHSQSKWEAWGSMWGGSPSVDAIAYPFRFVEKPLCVAYPIGTKILNPTLFTVMGARDNVESILTKTPSVNFYRPVNNIDALTLTLGYYVTGRWK